tara:strand:+ start:67880 stop:68104 length:225 start_codon:yes stop_codon:yes gene_type:complete
MSGLPVISIKREGLKNQDLIFISFKYNEDLISVIKETKRFRWNVSKRCWYLPFSNSNLDLIHQIFGAITIINID